MADFKDVLAVFSAGQKLRQAAFPKGKYIQVKAGEIVDQDGAPFTIEGRQILRSDWEIYAEEAETSIDSLKAAMLANGVTVTDETVDRIYNHIKKNHRKPKVAT